MTRTWLCLDAGVTTGWSYWEDGALIDSGALRYEDDSQFLKAARELVKRTGRPDLVVMEVTKPHYGKLYQKCRRIQLLWVSAFPHLQEIDPWMWKTSHNKAKLPKHCKTQHERDAIRIGMWIHKHLDANVPLPWQQS